MPCYKFEGCTPVVHVSAYVHPTAVLIGDVIIGAGCYVGPLASLRGDFGRIILRDGSNVQDTCVMHGFPASDTVVEQNGHVGHGAVLHGCIIGTNVLVGINAVVMDRAVIGANSIIAAASFVKNGFVCAERSLVMGAPASVKRILSDEEIAWKSRGTEEYQILANKSLFSMEECEPLGEVEHDRRRVNSSSYQPKS